MYFFNEYEVNNAMRLTDRDRDMRPNNFKAAMILHRLMVWANNNSDGWAHWPKPMRSATQLAQLIAARTGHVRWEDHIEEDISNSELKRALVPIKSFLTRQGVAHSEIIKDT